MAAKIVRHQPPQDLTRAVALDQTEYEYQTLKIAKYVAGKFQLFRRRNNLSWSHHVEVAALPADESEAHCGMAYRLFRVIADRASPAEPIGTLRDMLALIPTEAANG